MSVYFVNSWITISHKLSVHQHWRQTGVKNTGTFFGQSLLLRVLGGTETHYS